MNRSERRRLRTHLELLTALRAELAQAPPDAVTVQAVTDRADVALGTFYNHFDDKSGALDALCELEIRALRLQTQRLTLTSPELPRYASALAVVLIQRAAADPEWTAAIGALVDAGLWPTADATAWHRSMLRAARPAMTDDQLTWHTNAFHGSIIGLCRVLTNHGFTGPMLDRMSTVAGSIVGSLGFDAEVMSAEAEWARSVPISLEWEPAEEVVAMDELGAGGPGSVPD